MSLAAFSVALTSLSHCTEGALALFPSMCAAGLCQGADSPVPLQLDFLIEAKTKQQ